MHSSRQNVQRKQTTVESFTAVTAKLNAVSENVSFLRRAFVQNEVTDIHKFIGAKFGLSGHFMFIRIYARKRLIELIQTSRRKPGSDIHLLRCSHRSAARATTLFRFSEP